MVNDTPSLPSNGIIASIATEALKTAQLVLSGLQGKAVMLIAAVLFIDVIFGALHILSAPGSDLRLSVSSAEDGSAWEFWEALKSLMAGLLLLSLFRRTRMMTVFVLGGILSYAALDNALMIHERIAWTISNNVHVAEFLVMATIGLLALTVLSGTYIGAKTLEKRTAHAVGAGFALLAGCAIGVDFVHSMLLASAPPVVEAGLAGLEEGGELLSITFILAVSLGLHQALPRAVEKRKMKTGKAKSLSAA